MRSADNYGGASSACTRTQTARQRTCTRQHKNTSGASDARFAGFCPLLLFNHSFCRSLVLRGAMAPAATRSGSGENPHRRRRRRAGRNKTPLEASPPPRIRLTQFGGGCCEHAHACVKEIVIVQRRARNLLLRLRACEICQQ